MQGIDHHAELPDLATRLAGAHRRGVPGVRGEEADRVVPPVVRQTARHQEFLGHVVVHRQQLHRGYAETDQVLKRRVERQTGVGAAEFRWHAGMGCGESAHVHLVNDGVGERVLWAQSCRGRRAGEYHPTRQVRGRIQQAGRGWVIYCVPAQFGPEPHLAFDCARVRVEQQLGGVVAQAACGFVGPADAKSVELPGPTSGTNPCHTSPSRSGRASRSSVPSASNRHRVTCSPFDDTAKFEPCASMVAPRGEELPGRIWWPISVCVRRSVRMRFRQTR
jgi:hypothetical protein